MAKSEAKTVGIVDTEEALTAKIAEVRAAQAIFATYTQEQVDKIFKAAAIAANKARIPLAKMAVEETGMGIISPHPRAKKSTMLLSTSTTSTRMFRLVVFLRRTRLTAQ